jgi:hypothetical protein
MTPEQRQAHIDAFVQSLRDGKGSQELYEMLQKQVPQEQAFDIATEAVNKFNASLPQPVPETAASTVPQTTESLVEPVVEQSAQPREIAGTGSVSDEQRLGQLDPLSDEYAQLADKINGTQNAPTSAPVTNQPTKLQVALDCISYDLAVLSCLPHNKPPDPEHCPNGHLSATKDPAVATKWFTEKPTNNIGISVEASNLVVLDFDSGLPPAEMGLQNDFYVTTSRGAHVYFRSSGPTKSGFMYWNGQHIGEIKGSGFVMAPFSNHPSGAVYLPHGSFENLRTIDAAFLEMLRKKPAGAANEPPRNEQNLIPRGSIHPAMVQQAGRLRSVMGDISLETYDAALLEWVLSNCVGPIDESKVHAVAQNTYNSFKPGNGRELILSAAPQTADTALQKAAQEVFNLVFTSSEWRANHGYPRNAGAALNAADVVIYNHLKTIGKFFNVGGLGYFVETGKEDKPIKISKDDAGCSGLLERYNLNAGRAARDTVGKYLGGHSFTDGEHVKIHMSFHYDPKTMTAYYAEQRGTILKVTKDAVTRITNGTDGILFSYHDDYEPWTFTQTAVKSGLLTNPGEPLYDAVFKNLDFKASDLTMEQKRILTMAYVLLLFLPNLNGGKLILMLLGDSGGGKSFFLEVIGRLLIGSKFKPTSLPSDGEKFENQMINNAFVVYDNVKKVPAKIQDLMCSASTGMEIIRRELYTTSNQVTFDSQATFAVTSKKNPLDQIEHLNRSLIFWVNRRPRTKEGAYIGARDLTKDLNKQRDAIMSEIICRAQAVLRALDAEKDYIPRSNVRMAEVAAFIIRIARHENWEDKAKVLLAAWEKEQSEGALEDDEVGPLMVQAICQPNFQPKWMFASEFKNYLTGPLATTTQVSMGVSSISRMTPQELSAELINNIGVYAERYGLENQKNASTKTNQFRLNPSRELIDALRQSGPEACPASNQLNPPKILNQPGGIF